MTNTNKTTVELIEESLGWKEVERLSGSDEYANFIMANGDRLICNGDMLIEAMEDAYLFDEFLINKFA